MRKFIITSALTLVSSTGLLAQDVSLMQFYANPGTLNPAAMGTALLDKRSAGRAITQYRSHWTGKSGQFGYFNLGWDQHFNALRGGLGLHYTNQNFSSGFFNISQASIAYAPQIISNEKIQVNLGGEFGINNRTVNLYRPLYGDQLDPAIFIFPHSSQTINTSVSYPNFNAGLFLKSKSFYGGFSVYNVIEPNISMYKNPDDVLLRRFNMHGGYTFTINSDLAIVPQIQIQKQGTNQDLTLGAQILQEDFMYGIWYRSSRNYYRRPTAWGASAGWNIAGFRIIYSYDFTTASVRRAFYSSHELSLRFCWKTKQTRSIYSSAFN